MQRDSGRRRRESGNFAFRLQWRQSGNIWLAMAMTFGWADTVGESGIGNKEPNLTTV